MTSCGAVPIVQAIHSLGGEKMKNVLMSLSAFATMAMASSAVAYGVYCPWPYRPMIATGYYYVYTYYGYVLQYGSYWVCA